MNVELWAHQLVNGLTIGGVYALVALGYTMVYGILPMINFAHGEVFMVGAYAGYFALSFLSAEAYARSRLLLALTFSFFAAMAASGLLALLLERVAYRPLRRAPRLSPLISAIGASIFIQNGVMLLTGARMKTYPYVFPTGGFQWGVVSISYLRAFIIVTSILLMLALYLFVKHTKVGKAMRAVAEDHDAASLMGIDVNRIIAMT
ncbi:MAG: branched-chain amino acid ABC transporter permease, partial [Candidatus Methylomirabilales bacterium]